MSDITKVIRESAESVIQTALGVNWSILDHKFDLSKNSFINSTQKFGIVQLEGPPGPSMLKHYTVARIFEVIFATKYIPVLEDDSAQQTALDVLEDALDTAGVAIINTKAGNPSSGGKPVVNNVFFNNIEPPDIGETEENLAVLRLTLTIQYRRLLS